MKKIFFMAVSAVLLAAGCQKTEIQNEVIPQIGFKTQMGKLTKAPDAGNAGQYANLNEQGFMAWGYFVNENDLNYNPGDLYLGKDGKGIKVSAGRAKDTEGNEYIPVDEENNGVALSWETGEVHYWPGKGKSLDIYCVSLYDFAEENKTATNTYAKVTPYYSTKKLNVSGFIVDEGADNDLMVAPLITQNQDDAEFVSPKFQHALTKVLVKFTTTAEAGIYVVSAKITNVKSVADLEVSNVLDETVAEGPKKYKATFEWSDGTDPRSYDAQYTGTPETVSAAPSGVTEQVSYQAYAVPTYDAANLTNSYMTFGSWLLVPQKNLTNVTLEVTYIVDNVLVNTAFALGTGVEAWSYGMQTTYNVKITPEYITFDPIVEEWLDGGDKNHGDYVAPAQNN